MTKSIDKLDKNGIEMTSDEWMLLVNLASCRAHFLNVFRLLGIQEEWLSEPYNEWFCHCSSAFRRGTPAWLMSWGCSCKYQVEDVEKNMRMWSVREQSLVAIKGELKNENEVLEQILTVLEEYIRRFSLYARNDKEHEMFAIICGGILRKIHRFAHASYSLYLDGLFLEGGGMMRSLIEGGQTLTYLCQDPTRLSKLISKKPLKTGYLAQEIEARFPPDDKLHFIWHKMKKHYNETSSHFSMMPDTFLPLNETYSRERLEMAISNIYTYLLYICNQAQLCLNYIDPVDDALVYELRLADLMPT